MSAKPTETESAVPSQAEVTPSFKTLEEDDEFEDFPADDWKDEDTVANQRQEHLWDESWDDDEDGDDFTQKLR
ncbi:unnamed protein product [Kuraishia capsulata CBS 1993]|uniref:26S proteasome complex subunit SEM1 n=1 Tax=Kuraishia capsulata CBS 1993 TaxID=1382522 RepID=W6MJD2_9ASCO|nr:uncharacterized protein KUCA_T00000492001 [Kuraishia capsulata CBS 1993]CDK24527.1 unnamed protein product [Kuraishia capsulata CBS 1993]